MCRAGRRLRFVSLFCSRVPLCFCSLTDMAQQLARMSQLAIDVENLKMRNTLLESELLRARQVLRRWHSVGKNVSWHMLNDSSLAAVMFSITIRSRMTCCT